jgi:hypothetical protein
MIFQITKIVAFTSAFTISTFIQMSNLDLTDYRWKNRILLLFSNDNSSDNYQAQIQSLFTDKPGLLDRDMLVFSLSPQSGIRELIYDNKFNANPDMWTKYKITEEEFHVLLIGKDGSVKFRDDSPISNDKLFGIIDAMPMRRAEMRNKNKD